MVTQKKSLGYNVVSLKEITFKQHAILDTHTHCGYSSSFLSAPNLITS